MMKTLRLSLIVAALVFGARHILAGGEHSGQVTFGGLPVPGATITASSGEKKLVTATDEQGTFQLADATEGVWTLHVEMLGFEGLTREVTVTAEPQPSAWTLVLRPFDDITRGIPRPPPVAAPSNGAPAPSSRGSGPASAPAQGRGGFQRAGVTATAPPTAANRPTAPIPDTPPAADAGPGASDGFLINGSVNNGAASPFAQAAAFGNNRRGRGSLFNYQLAIIEGNSAFDARPFSFAGQPVTKPAYNDFHMNGTFGGPLRFKHFMPIKGPNVFLAFQHGDDHNATTQPGVMPTALERLGDFSQSTLAGRPLQIIDPATGRPFAGNLIPSSRISPQAASLLGYYPQPNFVGTGYNFQAPLTTFTRLDQFTSRVTQGLNNRNQLIGLFAYQRNATDQTSIFGFQDASSVSGVDTSLTWTHRVNQFVTIRPRGQYTELTTSATPFFANRTNVSGLAGITGNNQDPANWGPPSLTFATIAGLTDALPNFTRTRTYGGGVEAYWSHGRHNLTFGGDLRRIAVDIESQQNPRGSFTFNGAVTGSDLADFLLGVPGTSAIAFGNADKNLRGYSSDAYLTDDWRFSPTLTMQLGARWEYDTPPAETLNRLVNLDVAPGFSSASPVLGSLLQPDRRGIQPRVGLAWRPVPGSSLVIRAGYGVYRNQNVYQPIVTLLAQQPPLSKAFAISNTPLTPLTLANGFTAPSAASNTFAVDPNLRIGEAQNWQALVQRDLPGSLTMTATYLGTKGTDLLQEFLPNTYPIGGVNPCPSCPSGFVYLTSNGNSSRHAGQFQLRRRLRNGLMASVQYTLAKARDNATAFAGVSLSGTAIAQDWRNLDAEMAPSNFDQRHQINAQVQYTTGMGVGGGALLDGMKGRLLKGWTMTGQLVTGSGLPITPYFLSPAAGTGVTGALRPSLTGVSTDPPSGSYLNPAAYALPASGQWGDAGRNSMVGPMQFNFGAGITRTFQLTERLSVDWRIDATNVINRETYTNVNTIFGGQQFGLPGFANTPRKVQSTIRMRF
jgi:outer membrane receptor protein involved in Fe transport